MGEEQLSRTRKHASVDDAASGDTPTAAAWQSRDGVATALRVLITLAPIVGALNVSLLLNVFLPAPSSWSWAFVRVAAIAIVAMCSVAVIERLGRRLLPLPMLLRLSLVFPDETPSRFKMALISTT